MELAVVARWEQFKTNFKQKMHQERMLVGMLINKHFYLRICCGLKKVGDRSARPFIRWAGSKKKLLPELKANMPADYNRYIEPFCGSACLFFELSPERALLSDINQELINAYRVLRDRSDIYKKLLSLPVTKIR